MGVEGKAVSSTQPPNGNPDATAETSPSTPPDTSTDATIGRFRDAVQSIKEASPPVEKSAKSQVDSLTDSADRSAAPLKSVMAEQFDRPRRVALMHLTEMER